MKKSLFILIAATAAVLSCVKENPNGNEPQQKLVFTGVTDPTKTVLESDFSITWSTEDDITVFPGENASGVTFDVTATSNNGHTATFEGNAAASANYYALSPAQVGVSIADGKISAILPTAQTPVAGSFGPESNVAVAVASDYVFQFKNVGALVGFTIGQDDITGVKLEALNGEVLSGTAVVNPADGSLVSKSGESYVQISGNLAKNATYYFVALPGTYAGGFRITLFKGAQYARTSLAGNYDIPRNGNLSLGTLALNNWKTAFVEGEDVVIKGSAEDGQKLAYVGASGYWQEVRTNSVRRDATENYPFNYEIFTNLTAGQTFHFKADGGERFSLNAAGTAVIPIASSSQAAYSIPSEGENWGSGIYRIRMNLPEGTAEVKKIDRVVFSQWAVDSKNLTYVEKGEWKYDNLPMRRGSNTWDNRYKFNIRFADGSNQYYGRWYTSAFQPIYGTTSADHYYVEPANETDNWDPGFQFPAPVENVTELRYYGNLHLYMNNDNSHYTHKIEKVWPIITGEDIYIKGTGVEENGNQMKVRYSTSFYNSSVNNYGDQDALAAPVGYDYEIFVQLSHNNKFYFQTASGTLFAIKGDGSSLDKINDVDAIEFAGAPVDGNRVYRIRIKSSDNTFTLNSIWQVHYLQPGKGTNQNLTYQGNGVWVGYPSYGWDDNQGWGDDRKYGMKYQMYFDNGVNIWQYIGVNDGDTVQFIKDTDATTNTDNFLSAKDHSDWISGSWKWMNANLQMNSEGYRHWLSSFRN